MRRLTGRQRMAALALAVLALCFITLDLGGSSLRGAHNGVRGSLGSLYRGTDAVLGPVRRFVVGIPSAGTSEGTIERLQHDNTELRGRLEARSTDRRVAGELATLQHAADGSDHTLLPARVVGIGPGEGFDWTVTLDVGTQNGVRDGQTVTDGLGLVGRVLHADSASCVVLLAADPGSGVGARDTRTGQVGVATGRGSSGLEFVPLDPHAHVRKGDHLVTGPGRSSSYVAGLSVGRVTSVSSGADGTVRATVRPTTSPTSLDVVGVITDAGAGSRVADRAPLSAGSGR